MAMKRPRNKLYKGKQQWSKPSGSFFRQAGEQGLAVWLLCQRRLRRYQRPGYLTASDYSVPIGWEYFGQWSDLGGQTGH